ncbi:hypothetical protein OsJ_01266 [Oryza sativa Japonica Group]|uniref:Uncharacterized protein n=2 Tax=Oryza sativa subsp. japonica TaxID=39947 RepID=B9EV64_ORYSJ|nr:hypothetical protein OsJ_01266 [Oryza sativa Japonica Group]
MFSHEFEGADKQQGHEENNSFSPTAEVNEKSENTHIHGDIRNKEDYIEDPDIANSKGRTKQRYKTIREQIEDKETNHCSHCGRTEHTFPTCPFKHIEFYLARKRKRKIPSKPQKSGEEEKKEATSKKRKPNKKENTEIGKSHQDEVQQLSKRVKKKSEINTSK